MARPQAELQALLEASTDAQMVAFQEPSTLQYPAIVYDQDLASDVHYADNVKYILRKGYTVTVMAREPDSPIPDQVEALPHSKFDRKFKSDGIHHFVYQLFF